MDELNSTSLRITALIYKEIVHILEGLENDCKN